LNKIFINYYIFARFTFNKNPGCRPAVNQGERGHQKLEPTTTHHHHDGGVTR
jgi:hypothetical protein